MSAIQAERVQALQAALLAAEQAHEQAPSVATARALNEAQDRLTAAEAVLHALPWS